MNQSVRHYSERPMESFLISRRNWELDFLRASKVHPETTHRPSSHTGVPKEFGYVSSRQKPSLFIFTIKEVLLDPGCKMVQCIHSSFRSRKALVPHPNFVGTILTGSGRQGTDDVSGSVSCGTETSVHLRSKELSTSGPKHCYFCWILRRCYKFNHMIIGVKEIND